MNIIPKPGITHEEILEELSSMSFEEILSVPLTGRFTGLFETFEEMSKVAQWTMLGRRIKMKDDKLEAYSSDLPYDEKREVIRKCLNNEITHILVKDKITAGELEMLNILGDITGVKIVVSYEVDRRGDIVAIGQTEITEIDHKRALTELVEGLKQRIAYNIPSILKSLQNGDYDAIYDILSIKSNSRLLKKSVKELRLSDPKYRHLINRNLSNPEMDSLIGLGEAAKSLEMTKPQLNTYIKSYELMPDYITKKGIIYFLPRTIEKFRATLSKPE